MTSEDADTGEAGRLTARDEQAAHTRTALLAAGLEILAEQPTGKVFSHVTAGEVSRRAGLTTGAFYHHFPTQAAFLDAVFDQMRQRGSTATGLDDALDAVTEAAAAGGTFADAVIAGARANMAALVPDGLFRVQQVMVLGEPPGKTNPVRQEMSRETLQRGADAYDALADAMGREWRPPFTAETVALLLGGIIEGISVRKIALPDVDVPDDVAGWVIAAIIPLISRPPGDTADAGTWVAEVTPDWATSADPSR